MLFNILNRFTGAVQLSLEIDATEDTSHYIKLGLAVKAAIKQRADLTGADLYGANLYGANLTGANLYGADLYGANLTRANLTGANLYGADLYGANLTGANLTGADLTGANLTGANLYGANLYGANLTRANLTGADLTGANLTGADLTSTVEGQLAVSRTRILPEGQLIGWKKCKQGVIVKLSIPAEAKRSHSFGRKCRAEFADVLEVIGAEVGISQHDDVTVYEVGKRMVPDRFEEDWTKECAPGIHFFITREEAEAY